MKYKNISNKTLTIIGFGIVKPDGVIKTKQAIHNPNLKLVNEVEKQKEGKEFKIKVKK